MTIVRLPHTTRRNQIAQVMNNFAIAGFGETPVLDLNFVGSANPLPASVTFTRASTGTRINSAGLIESVTTDQPRFDYDPVTLAPMGLLIEEQRTNLCLQSASLSTSPWVVNGSPGGGTTVAPDGSNALNITWSTSATGYYQIFNPAGNTAYTFSAYVKKVSGTNPRVQIGSDTASFGASAVCFSFFDPDTLTFSNTQAGVTATGYVAVGNGWYRIWVTGTTIASPGSCAILAYAVINVATISMWGYVVEAGAFPTSYIPTTAAAVTRAADVASMTGTNFSNWFNATEGTFVASADSPNTSIAAGILSANDTTANNFLGIRVNSGGASYAGMAVSGGVNQTTINGPAISVGAITKSAHSYLVGTGRSFSSKGSAATFQAGYSALVSPSILNIGYSPTTNPLNGHIQRITYYNKRLPDATLQALSI